MIRPMERKREFYRKYSTYLKEKYGTRVSRISVNAGFDCPNRDGKLSKEGCIFCDNRAFSYHADGKKRALEEQIGAGIKSAKERYRANKFIVYFQAFTNTYAPVERLKRKYDSIRGFSDIVGLAIGTRPDCVPEEVLDLLEGYSDDFDVWLELGIQSIHDKTLRFINRGHTNAETMDAIGRIKRRDRIKICAHVILGLPGEDESEMIQTAMALGDNKIDGVKIHPLHIIKDTALEKLYRRGVYVPLEMEDYVKLAVSFIENLRPAIVIERIGADCPQKYLIEPQWINNKSSLLMAVEEEFDKRNGFQGKRLKNTRSG